MRLDKFLKVSRLIKRRTVAASACSGGKIQVNSRTAKAGYELKLGDVIKITFGSRQLEVEVMSINEHAAKGDAANMYKILSQDGAGGSFD